MSDETSDTTTSDATTSDATTSATPIIVSGGSPIFIKKNLNLPDGSPKDIDRPTISKMLTGVKIGEKPAEEVINDETTPVISLDIETFKQQLKHYIKSNFLDFVDNKNDLLNSYVSDMQNSPIASQMGNQVCASSQLVLFYDKGDTYGFFSNILTGSTSTMNNKLKDINMISSVVNLGKSKDATLKKYYYLLHSINPYGLTTLQWACFHNRVDIVMLILSYLVGGDKEYVRKYINYNNNDNQENALYLGRAYDMIGRSKNIGAYSSAIQALKSTGSIFGNVLSFNLKTALTDIFRKTKNVITAPGQVPIDNILIAFGSIVDNQTEIEKINKNVAIQDKYDDRLMLSDTNQNLSMGVSNVPKNVMRGFNSGINSVTSLFGRKTGGKYKSRRYKKVNKRFTHRNYMNKSSKTGR